MVLECMKFLVGFKTYFYVFQLNLSIVKSRRASPIVLQQLSVGSKTYLAYPPIQVLHQNEEKFCLLLAQQVLT